MKRRARGTVYWPKIDEDIEKVVRECEACQTRLPSQQKEAFMEREEPSRPFEQVGADFFSYGNREYLAYVDRASGWLSVWLQKVPTYERPKERILQEEL